MIVEIAELIGCELDGVSEEVFSTNRTLIDATAYRLGSLGEYVNRLSPELKARHPHVAWRKIYSMRNALFHDYEGVLAIRLWVAAGDPLAELVAVCLAELTDKNANPGSPAASP